MISIGHCGIYVDNIDRVAQFYIQVFGMNVICKNQIDTGEWIDSLCGTKSHYIVVTKLITERGKVIGSGDMIELVKIMPNNWEKLGGRKRKFTDVGVSHVGFICDDIQKISGKIIQNGGKIFVQPFKRENGNWLCFGCDIEGNFIELIGRES